MLMSTLISFPQARTLPDGAEGWRTDAEIDYHSQQMALPASTQKVITALAALLQLGPDFRFTTTLETKGNVEGGVLKGDLIARFGGDPTLNARISAIWWRC
jgi:PBP4 family serine-type D-alanyl-D-alanine carboxypeptidase